MIAAGVNAKALSTYMGHSSITITLDRYGHLMPGNEAEAAGMLEAYLEREGSFKSDPESQRPFPDERCRDSRACSRPSRYASASSRE